MVKPVAPAASIALEISVISATLGVNLTYTGTLEASTAAFVAL